MAKVGEELDREVIDLQSRDPFSGDCDCADMPISVMCRYADLAEPRPVLRGLRRAHTCDRDHHMSGLAEPRPVLMGLRLGEIFEA